MVRECILELTDEDFTLVEGVVNEGTALQQDYFFWSGRNKRNFAWTHSAETEIGYEITLTSDTVNITASDTLGEDYLPWKVGNSVTLSVDKDRFVTMFVDLYYTLNPDTNTYDEFSGAGWVTITANKEFFASTSSFTLKMYHIREPDSEADYQYNGLPLPKEPQYDTNVYPNSSIIHNLTGERTVLFMASTEPTAWNKHSSYTFNGTIRKWQLSGNEWTYIEELTGPYTLESYAMVWTNSDVISEAGNVIHSTYRPRFMTKTRHFELKTWLGGFVQGQAGRPLLERSWLKW